MENHGRMHNGFLYTVEGTETYHFQSKSIDAAPNSILFIPKGEKYTIDLYGDTSSVIAFDFEIAEKCEGQPFCVKMNKNSAIKSYFIDANNNFKKRKPEALAECKGTFYKIIAELIKKEIYYLNDKTRSKISEAVSYLHSHYLENDFKVSMLSDIAKISSRYFEVLFSKEFGMTPKEYVIALKLDQAKELLLNEKTSVSDVACQLGYSDVYHFSKFFKSKIGCSPSEYKRTKE
jgi:AraC-like DNA-binding protein